MTDLTLSEQATIPSLEQYLAVLDRRGYAGATQKRNSSSKALKAYLNIRPKKEDREIFIYKFGTPLGQRGVQLLVRIYLDEVGIKGANVHSLRHTFGTQHGTRGTSLRTVQEAVGHKDLKTTSIYVSLAREGDESRSFRSMRFSNQWFYQHKNDR